MTGPRVPFVEVGANAALAPIEARIQAARGAISPLYRVLLNSAPLVEGWEALLTAIRQKTSVPPALRELVILRVAVLNGAAYEFEAHVAHAQRAGISEEKINAVRERSAGLPFDETERIVLRLTDAMTRDIEVPDALYRELEAQFDPTELVELVATVAAYNMVSRFLVALRIGH
jgi:4-carboxymuconolactone decarboxylase